MSGNFWVKFARILSHEQQMLVLIFVKIILYTCKNNNKRGLRREDRSKTGLENKAYDKRNVDKFWLRRGLQTIDRI